MEKLEISVAEHAKDIKYMKEKLDSIEEKLDRFIERSDVRYTRNEEFCFWRNILVSGVLISIFLGILFQILTK